MEDFVYDADLKNMVDKDQEDQGLESKIAQKERELESAKVELKGIRDPEATLTQQNKIQQIQHQIAELKDRLKDINQK
jgi:hypothetical protein